MPAGNGLVVLTRPHGAALYRDGAQTAIGLPDAVGVSTGADGTVVFNTPRGLVLGFGTGQERQWVMLEP